MSTRDLTWMIVRNNHAFLKKVRDVKRPFSSEPGNLTKRHSCQFNGFVQKRIIEIEPCPSGKGFIFGYKSNKRERIPGKNMIRRTIKSTPRKSFAIVRNFCKKNRYRTDLLKYALRRASAILSSQKASNTQNERRQKKNRRNRTSKSGKGSKKTE